MKPRKRNIARIGFFPCVTDLPAPFTCVAIEQLVTDNALVFSSELVNVEVGDPVTEEVTISDCRPAQRIVVSRSITFQDRIAIEVAAGGSPSAPANPFYDYDFWKDKKAKKATMRYMLVFCDGSVVVPRDEFGLPMAAELDIFLSYERQGTGGNSYILEIKKGSLDFKGDPLDFNKAELDGSNEIFNINECAIGL